MKIAQYACDSDIELTEVELKELTDILQLFENYELRMTGMKNINGGYAEAIVSNYDDDNIMIELQWGGRDMARGSSVKHTEEYTLARDVILKDMTLSDKVREIKD